MKKDVLSLWLYILFLLAAFGLPFFSFGGYSIVKNTTSHLGAQGSPHSWLMNAVFVFLTGTPTTLFPAAPRLCRGTFWKEPDRF